jgi:hypothetical protein
MKTRHQNITELKSAIVKTETAIARTKTALAATESRLERQRASLNTQLMLNKFDQIDELRQQISDIIAANKWKSDGLLEEIESNEKL